MRIRITARGIYGVDGELPIGTELDVSAEPTGWAGRYIVLSDDPADKAELVVGYAPDAPAPDAPAPDAPAPDAPAPDAPAPDAPKAVAMPEPKPTARGK